MYNDLFDFGPSNKEMAALILIVFALLVAIFGLGYLFGCRSSTGTGENVHDNGAGAAGAGQQIEQAGADIQHAADGIREAERSADKIGSGITNAKESAQYIHSTAADSAGIIAECQSILEGIRRRGAQDQAAH